MSAASRSCRMGFLAVYPVCHDCAAGGRIRLATQTHHLRELAAGGEWLTPENTVGLCGTCRRDRTARGG